MAHILLVEDEVNIASFIQRGLLELGYEVSVANDGEGGWFMHLKDVKTYFLSIAIVKNR
jgi:Response regulators consisting of a CheY-like receiver domain and a winged-helix DNA-binding domain